MIRFLTILPFYFFFLYYCFLFTIYIIFFKKKGGIKKKKVISSLTFNQRKWKIPCNASQLHPDCGCIYPVLAGAPFHSLLPPFITLNSRTFFFKNLKKQVILKSPSFNLIKLVSIIDIFP